MDETKLPKWAQRELNSLRRQVRELQKIGEEEGDGTVFIPLDWKTEREVYAPRGVNIKVQDPFAAVPHLSTIHVTVVDNGLNLNTPDGFLAVYPDAANTVTIQVTRNRP